jgi:hypothetical protein
MVDWYCKRCATKLKKSIEPEPAILRRCTGCDVENYCYPAGHAGEDAEPEKVAEIARSQAAVHGKTEAEREEAESIPDDMDISESEQLAHYEGVEDEVQAEDAEDAAETAPSEAPVEDVEEPSEDTAKAEEGGPVDCDSGLKDEWPEEPTHFETAGEPIKRPKITVEEENVTGATDPYADLSKEDLLERIKALEAEENQT